MRVSAWITELHPLVSSIFSNLSYKNFLFVRFGCHLGFSYTLKPQKSPPTQPKINTLNKYWVSEPPHRIELKIHILQNFKHH